MAKTGGGDSGGVVLVGARGRVGQKLDELVRESASVDGTLSIVGVIERDGSLSLRPQRSESDCSVVIDFSSDEGTRQGLRFARDHGVPIVIGTTALSENTLELVKECGRKVPVVLASNTSIGVNILNAVLSLAKQMLPPSWDCEIVEIHHRMKKDAPSGTARSLLSVVDGQEMTSVYGREGPNAMRTTNEIGVHAVRGGDVTGEHTVYLFGEGERVELTHRATDRSVFARGALYAARWALGCKKEGKVGVFSMKEVLRLRGQQAKSGEL